MITLFYDDTCVLCTTNAVQMQAKNPSEIDILPVDMALDVLANAGISRTHAMTYVCVQDGNGNVVDGMNAISLLCDVAGSWVAPVLHFPVIKQVCKLSYPFFARNRYYFPRWAIRLMYGKVVDTDACVNGVCQIPPEKRGKETL